MMIKVLLFAPLLFLFSLIPPTPQPQAKAAKDYGYGYAVLCITNDTDYNITYTYHWGNGEVQTNTLYPGKTFRHWWTYTSYEHISPAFNLSYDEDPSSYKRWRNVELKRYRSEDTSCDGAKEHSFYFGSGQINIREDN